MRLKPLLLALFLGALAPASVAAGPALELRDPAVQGGLVRGQTLPGARVWLDDRAVRVSPDGAFVFGFGRDAVGEAQLRVALPDGSTVARRLTVEPRRYQIQRIDGLPPSKVTPAPEMLQRIRREAAQVRRARDRDDPRADFTSGWTWPVTGPVTGVYGSQRILNGEPRRPHFGVDIAAPVGTPVVAPADGVVTLVHPDMYFSGGTLILDHGHGLSSSFLHLSRILVEEGERVRAGDTIAEVGATGRVTGAHLDWRMNWFDARVDPALLVPAMEEARAQAAGGDD